MKIEGCEFPDDLLYDSDGLVWGRVDAGEVVVGITSLYAGVTGRIAKVSLKPLGAVVPRGGAIGFLESPKHFGPIRAPVAGVVQAVNEKAVQDPRTMTDSPYAGGWVARLRASDLAADRTALHRLPADREQLAKQIGSLRVRCFAAFPDHEMFEIGTECAAVLVKLNELLAGAPVGDIVHLVTDDPTSPIEMVRWSDESGHPVIDERREGNLFHFLVRKAS